MHTSLSRWFIGVSLLAILSLPNHSSAQWSSDPLQNLRIDTGLLPKLASDGSGGCYIVYEKNLVYPRQTVVKRLNRLGFQMWGALQLEGNLPDQNGALVTDDSRCGVAIAYHDYLYAGSSTDLTIISRLRVQRIDSSGHLRWGSTGIRASLSETNQGGLGIVNDQSGGCFVVWSDTNNQVRIQRLDSLGNRIFTDTGLVIRTAVSPGVAMVADGQNGCVVFVGDRTGQRYYRFDPAGNFRWGGDGMRLDSSASSTFIPDGQGGIILAGMRTLSYNQGDPYFTAFGQRIDSGGFALWGRQGLVLADSIQSTVLSPPYIILEADADGGATFAWGNRIQPGVMRGFARRVHADGSTTPWGMPRYVSAFDSGSNGTWRIVTSSGDSKIFVNSDERFGGSVFAQRMDSCGSFLWPGTDICISQRQLTNVQAVGDGHGGLISIGFDQSDFSVRAQQCSRNGILGEILSSVRGASDEGVPIGLRLFPIYPNPFNSSTVISYTIPRTESMTLKIYDILGSEIQTLFDGIRHPGEYRQAWDATKLPSGIYFVIIRSSRGVILSDKAVLSK